MDQIARVFAARFAHWGITLPAENLESRSSGHIQRSGWLIQFCFGRDEKDDYLDYYASHRMTDDDHVRVYEHVTQVELAALHRVSSSQAMTLQRPNDMKSNSSTQIGE
jgi:hypothetical protein